MSIARSCRSTAGSQNAPCDHHTASAERRRLESPWAGLTSGSASACGWARLASAGTVAVKHCRHRGLHCCTAAPPPPRTPRCKALAGQGGSDRPGIAHYFDIEDDARVMLRWMLNTVPSSPTGPRCLSRGKPAAGRGQDGRWGSYATGRSKRVPCMPVIGPIAGSLIDMSKHVFLSFVEEDLELVRLFRGQAKNKNSALSFDDYSVQTPYNSLDAEYIKSQIRPRIRASSALICLIGTKTYRSSWVKWEIDYAAGQGRRLCGVRLHSGARNETTPNSLLNCRAAILNWDIEAIVKWIG